MQLKALSILGFLVLFSFGCNNNSPADTTPETEISTTNKQLEELEKQVASNPQADSLREGLIEQLVQNNQYDKAMAQIEQLLQKQPGNPAYLFMKADALERKGDTSNAITAYQQAIRSAGVFNEAELRLASLYAETGNKTAVILCDALLKDASAVQMRSDILFVKAAYYSRVKDVTKALSIYNQIIREDYTYMEAYIEKGLIFYDQQKYADAWKIFQQSTNVSNKYADGYFWMAKTEEKMNKTKEAIDNYKRSLALDQSITEAREALKRLGEIK